MGCPSSGSEGWECKDSGFPLLRFCVATVAECGVDPTTTQDVRHALTATSSPFSNLEGEAVERLACLFEAREYQAGDYLIRQGDLDDRLFVMLDGQADAMVHHADGRTILLSSLDRGSLVGEMRLLTRAPRSADVVCRTPVRVAALEARDFHTLAEHHPAMLILLTEIMTQRLGQSTFDGLSGKDLEGYRVERCVGRGGMGVVYEATRMVGGERVALKMMNHTLLYRPQAIRNFHREADILSSLSHRTVAKLHARFSAYRTQFLVMEYCDGRTVRELLSHHGPLPETEVRKIVGQLADALRYLRAKSLAHLDLTPSNIMVSTTGGVKLLDFGLARALRPEEPVSDETFSELSVGSLRMAGTPRYMAPEQFGESRSPDHRADWYALGCVAYEAVAGRPVVQSDDLFSIVREQQRFEIPPAADIGPGVTEEMHEFLTSALQKRSDERLVDLEALSRWASPVELQRD